MFKKFLSVVLACAMTLCLCSCSYTDDTGSRKDTDATIEVGNELSTNQPTPTDVRYSLERYNLIKRTYWVNGLEEKARTLPCPVQKPLGYIILLSESGAVVSKHVVDGKVSSLNSFLSPDSEYYDKYRYEGSYVNKWLPDADGSYGENDNGIFFFDEAGDYWEWNGDYLYSSNPFTVKDPIITYEVKGDE